MELKVLDVTGSDLTKMPVPFDFDVNGRGEDLGKAEHRLEGSLVQLSGGPIDRA